MAKRTTQYRFRFWSATLVTAMALAGLVLPFSDGVAQQTNENTFRLLTFQVGSGGPRLGTTRGNGQEDIVDVHNAILYLVKAGVPEVSGLSPVPIDMRSLIEAGEASVRSVQTGHACGRVKDSMNPSRIGEAAARPQPGDGLVNRLDGAHRGFTGLDQGAHVDRNG